jgi:hypothetical protein
MRKPEESPGSTSVSRGMASERIPNCAKVNYVYTKANNKRIKKYGMETEP